jgi:hypothetical protein
MKAVIICPDRRAEVAFLARKTPLVLVPVLGPTLLSHWLTHLADSGVKEVALLASDRPDQVRAAMGRGERWGMKIEVLAEARELSVAEARVRFNLENVVLADRLPALPEAPLFDSSSGFFSALQRWQPLARQHRVGAKEIAPGIWAGLRCKIDSDAKLVAPCWLGENVWIRAHATIGPDAFLEDSALVDHDAEVVRSWVGPWTYVGALTHVNQSLAWADGLLQYASGSFTEIVDMFLLGDLQGGRGFARSSSWYGRLLAFVAAIVSSPLVLLAAIRNSGSGRPLFERKRAVIPTAVTANSALREMDYRELNGFTGLARRWPQLWSIVRGDFTWVGNRPVTREQAAELETEFEQLWLAAPVGFVSLADTFGCGAQFDDAARAHSGFYAVRADGRLDRVVLRWMIFGASPKP